MMSTKAVELANLINSDLTWKTVAKGSRSATRRTKKPVSRSAMADMEVVDKSATDVEGIGVSDSEKFGVAVLGRHFGNKVEHVPIKKRRFMLNSPSSSPSRKASPRLGVKKQFLNGGADACKLKSKKLTSIDDFSGIEILAAVACNGGLGDDSLQFEVNPPVEESVRKKTSSASLASAEFNNHAENPSVQESLEVDIPSASSAPAEINVSLQSTAVSSEDIIHERGSEICTLQDNLVNVSRKLKVSDDSDNKKNKDDRLHWDLNLSMDAWEQPCDDGDNESQLNVAETSVSENLHVLQDAQIQMEGVENSNDNVDRVVQSDLHPCTSMSSKVTESLCQPVGFNKEDHNMESCSEVLQNHSTSSSDAASFWVPSISDVKGSQVSNIDMGFNFPNCPNNVASVHVLDGKKDTSLYQCGVDQNVFEVGAPCVEAVKVEKCSISSPFTVVSPNCEADRAEGKLSVMPCVENAKDEKHHIAPCEADDVGLKLQGVLSVENVKLEKFDAASPHKPVLGNCKIDASDLQLDATSRVESAKMEKNFVASGCRTVPESCKINFAVQIENISPHAEKHFQQEMGQMGQLEDGRLGSVAANDEFEMQQSPSMPERKSEISVDECTTMAADDAGQPVPCDYQLHSGLEDLVHNFSGHSVATCGENGSTSLEVGRPVDDAPTSSFSKIGVEGSGSRHEGYDSNISQDYRGCVSCGQSYAELQAGYDSQFEDGELRESDPCWEETDGDVGEIEHVDYGSEPEGERFCHIDENENMELEDGKGEMVSEFDDKNETAECCPPGDASGKSSVSLKKAEPNDCMSAENHAASGVASHSKDSSLKGAVSRPSKRDLPSRVEKPLTSETFRRDRSDGVDDSFIRESRNVSSYKFMGRDRPGLYARGKNPGIRNFSYWDSKNGGSLIYNVSYNSGRPRPKSVVESHGYGNGSENHLRRQFLNSTNGPYRGINRRKSPGDRDESYIMQGRNSPRRENISPDRSRFRRYPEWPNRVVRGIDRPIPGNSAEYRGRLQHRLSRRERSNSPASGRLHYNQLYKKSRSRSRSRSPGPWHRNNPSPSFRPDARMDRVRLPFQKRFPADHEMGFMSPPRSRCSPQPHPRRNSRWFEDRNDNNLFHPNQRFDSVQSIRRVNSEDHFRPPIRPRRFHDMPPGGRLCKYEGSDEDDNHGNRYEVHHRVRRSDNDGGIRRLRFNGGQDSSFVANDS